MEGLTNEYASTSKNCPTMVCHKAYIQHGHNGLFNLVCKVMHHQCAVQLAVVSRSVC